MEVQKKVERSVAKDFMRNQYWVKNIGVSFLNHEVLFR